MTIRQSRLRKEKFAQRGDHWYEAEIRKERARRGSRKKYEKILANVPDVEPEAYDMIPTQN